MATVRAQRLLNSVMSGTTTGAQLQTLLTTPSNLSDYQQLLVERGKARLLTNTTNGFTAVVNSDTAFNEYGRFPTCTNELNLSPLAQSIFFQYPALLRDSSSRMTTVFSSDALRAIVFSDFTFETTVIQSQYMPEQWQYFYDRGATNGVPQPVTRTVPSTFGGGQSIVGAAYGNGVWVAVSRDTNKAARSLDNGRTWVLGSNAVSDATLLRDVAYGNGVFVAVGDSGRVITSADGNANWVARTSGVAVAINCIKFANGVFVAVTSTAIISSTDGITWTSRATGLTIAANNSTFALSNVDYGDGRWMVGGSNNVYTSTDLTTWTNITAVFAAGSSTTSGVRVVVYGNGRWIVGGSMEGSMTPTGAVALAYSTNGTTFTPNPLPSGVSFPSGNTNRFFRGGVYANGLFILEDNGTVGFTLDGITFASGATKIGTWASLASFNKMVYANGQLVGMTSGNSLQTMF